MKKLFAFSAAAFLFAPALAHGATAGALFSGSILSTCVLVAGTPGLITANGDYSEMSSHNGGGLASTVAATATGSSFEITTEAPSAFTLAPAGANTGTTFSSSYALSGATIAAEADGAVAGGLNIGLTTVTVHMAATKSGDAFPASLTYTATVTVRCE